MYLHIDRWVQGRISGAQIGGLTEEHVGGELG